MIKGELQRDTNQAEAIKTQVSRVQENLDKGLGSLNERKDLVESYEAMIQDSENAYNKVCSLKNL